MDSKKAKLLLLSAALCWSSGGILIKWVEAGPLAVAGLRSLISGIVLLFLFRPAKPGKSFAECGAIVTYALTVISFVTATKWTSAANAILLQSTAPIYVALLGTFYLKEKIRGIDILTILSVLVGMIFFFQGELSLEGFRGNLVGLFSGLAFASFIVFTRKAPARSSLGVIVVGNFLAALLTLPFVSVGAWPEGTHTWLGLLALGIFQLSLPYYFYSKSIAHVPAIDAVLIVLLEPILNPLWVFLFLGELPTGWSLVGGFIVLISVGLRSLLLATKQKTSR